MDPGWITAINWADDLGYRFGEDLFFTYGPWGFLTAPLALNFSTVVWAAAFSLLGISGYFFVLRSAITRGHGAMLSELLAGVLAVLTYRYAGASWTVLMALVAGTLLHLWRDSPSRYVAPAVAVTAGLLLQVKFSEGLLAASLVLMTVLGRRRPSEAFLSGGVLVGSFLGWWMLAGGHVEDLGPWFRWSLEIVIEYPNAMYYEVPIGIVGWVMGPLLVLGCAVCALYRPYASWSGRALALLSSAGVLFIAFKQGFTRHEPLHELAFYTAIVAVSVSAAGQTWVAKANRVAIAGLAMACMVITNLYSDSPLAQQSWTVATRVLVDGDYREQRLEEAARSRRLEYGLSSEMRDSLAGRPVVVDPFEITLAWAYGLEWHPLPVFQPYSAYSVPLDELNSVSLLSDPDMAVLREATALDDRLQLWDSPQYNVTLLCHFRPSGGTERWTLFLRSDNRCHEPERVGLRRVASGVDVELPEIRQNDAMVARFFPKEPSLRRQVLSLVAKPIDPLQVQIGDASHRLPVGFAGAPLIVRLPQHAQWPHAHGELPRGSTIRFSEAGTVVFERIPLAE